MSQVKGKNTTPEILVRKFLFVNGYRYRLHYRNLPGSPDIVLPKYKTVIFIHGCFWHRHKNCKKASIPKENFEFWNEKFLTNIKRDKKNIRDLKKLGWKIIIIWECQLKANKTSQTLVKLLAQLY